MKDSILSNISKICWFKSAPYGLLKNRDQFLFTFAQRFEFHWCFSYRLNRQKFAKSRISQKGTFSISIELLSNFFLPKKKTILINEEHLKRLTELLESEERYISYQNSFSKHLFAALRKHQKRKYWSRHKYLAPESPHTRDRWLCSLTLKFQKSLEYKIFVITGKKSPDSYAKIAQYILQVQLAKVPSRKMTS